MKKIAGNANCPESHSKLNDHLSFWTVTSGLQPAGPTDLDGTPAPGLLLKQLESYASNHVFLIKDFHPYVNDPVIIRHLRDLLPVLIEQQKTVLMFGPSSSVPLELEKDSVKIELPLPDYDDLQQEFGQTLDALQRTQSQTLELTTFDEERLINSVLGLTAQEAKKAWLRVLRGQTKLTDHTFTTLIAEKRTLAAGSDFLEFYGLEENVADIGGLDQLKEWIAKRAEAYSPRAREQGVPLPKGMLLLGIQGCGKSLTARATARLLSFPLIRLDIAALLGAQRGESEKNMRTVLSLVESIAPAVLWLDEIEKGFAGVENDGETAADATMLRLLGTFLTWMAGLKQPIFVVATTNAIENLPPEMLRRGRFDELFFVDLPNFDERRNILDIHLRKRGWQTDTFDLDDLARRSEGFSGAELEQIVVTALIDAFGNQRVLSQADLELAWRSTVPLSVTMEDKIFQLRTWAQDRCRRATSDSRVTAMLDEDQRREAKRQAAEKSRTAATPAWMRLAAAGQMKAAIVEFVRAKGDVLFPELTDALDQYLTASGDQGLAVRSNPNLVLWTGLSQATGEMICELVTSKRLYVHPTDVERYKSIQRVVRLPLVKEPTDEKLPRATWLPSSLRTAPHPIHGGRLARIGRMKLGSSE